MTSRPANFLFRLLAVVAAVLLLAGGAAVVMILYLYGRILFFNPTFAKPFAEESVPLVLHAACIALAIAAVAGLIAAALALAPIPRGKIALTIAICCVYIQSAAWIFLVDTTINVIGDKHLEIRNSVPDLEELVHLKMKWVLPGLATGLLALRSTF